MSYEALLLQGSSPVAGTGLVSGRYYPLSNAQYSLASTAQNQNQARCTAFLPDATEAYAGIGAEVVTVGEAGSVVRLSIYGDNGAEQPGALLADLGTIPGDAAGSMTLNTPYTFKAGTVYWLCAVAQLCPTTPPNLRTCTPALSRPRLSYLAPPGNNTFVGWLVNNAASGAMPAQMPAPSQLTGAGVRFYGLAA